MLMAERANLLKVVGAAAIFIAHSDPETMSNEAMNAADNLSEQLNALPEETLQDALGSVRAV
jgi:PDZ domain-containing secreted protein